MIGCHIKLDNNKRWTTGKSADGSRCWYFSGHLYKNSVYFSEHNIDVLFLEGFNVEDIKTFTGNFAFIYMDETTCYAVADRKRSIPLFYFLDSNGKWVITDKLQLPNKHGSDHLNYASTSEFLLTGFVANDRTLIDGVFQLEAGEYLTISQKQLSKNRYFQFYHQPVPLTVSEASQKLEALFHKVFEKLFDRVHKKHIILPLSGGYDSRIIALLLKEYGIDRITSFTYGKSNSVEAVKSKEIANRLGIKWSIVPYDKKSWKKWYQSDEWENYKAFASNYSSMAHIQDWPAVKELAKSLDELSVFIPGHSGDFLAGSHLPAELVQKRSYTMSDIIEQIMRKHHRLWETKSGYVHQTIMKGIAESLEGFEYEGREEASALFEYWDWKERQAKFIINSVRVYEYFEHDWEIPLWDDDLINFFLMVPVEMRYQKYLYNYTLNKMYPNFFEEPAMPVDKPIEMTNKYGAFYPILRKIYQRKRIYGQYFNDPMEWYGIKENYLDYLKNTKFHYREDKYYNPYNINSFLVKDYINKISNS